MSCEFTVALFRVTTWLDDKAAETPPTPQQPVFMISPDQAVLQGELSPSLVKQRTFVPAADLHQQRWMQGGLVPQQFRLKDGRG